MMMWLLIEDCPDERLSCSSEVGRDDVALILKELRYKTLRRICYMVSVAEMRRMPASSSLKKKKVF